MTSSAATDWPWTRVEDGLVLGLKVTPKARKERLGGLIHDADGRPWLEATVSAAPEDGKANQAVTRLLARSLGLRRSAVSLEAGARARFKRLRLAGEADVLAQRLVALVQAP